MLRRGSAGDDDVTLGIKERSEASCVAGVDEEIVHTGFIVDNYDGRRGQAESVLIVDRKSFILSHDAVFLVAPCKDTTIIV